MEKIRLVHCLFEQSGTFKKAFEEKGMMAFDYDIQNEFGQTDYVLDLFEQINVAYKGRSTTIFDTMDERDLVMAFFPCIYFTGQNCLLFSGTAIQFKNSSFKEKVEEILSRNRNRSFFYEMLLKLVAIANERKLRLIIENPYGKGHYLENNFILKPSLIDTNRSLHGDWFIKPTAYYALNCQLGHWTHYVKPKKVKLIQNVARSKVKGVCSKERSMISPDYAKNFIEDIILGSSIGNVQLKLEL